MTEKKQIRVFYRTVLKFSHLFLSVALGLFFMYAGAKKFMPPPVQPKPDYTEFFRAFEENRFEPPLTFKMGIKALKVSGFLNLVGILQLLAGLLMLLPRMRLIGLLLLLPLTANIFCFHFFMDNRPDENLETGFFLCLNLLLLAFYFPKLRQLYLKNYQTA